MMMNNIFVSHYGNEKVQDFFLQSKAEHTLAHAYLLSGPSHCGKTHLALTLAQSLLCESNNNCGSCHHCTLAKQYQHPDILILDEVPLEDEEKETKKTNLSLQERKTNSISIQDILPLQQALNRSTSNNWRIAIITEIERMSQEASNALLKILEEPPSKKILFLLTTTNSNRILETILSRVPCLEMSYESEEKIREHLITLGKNKEEIEKILLYFPHNRGFLNSLLEQPEIFQSQMEFFDTFITTLDQGSIYNALQYSASIDSKEKAQSALKVMANITLIKYRNHYFTEKNSLTILDLCAYGKKLLAANLSTKLVFERILLDIHPLWFDERQKIQ